MKKSILTLLIVLIGVSGLLAQSKVNDSASGAKAKSKPYTLTHKDSVLIQKLTKEAQSQTEEDKLLPINKKPGSGINDVIDVSGGKQ